MQIQTELTREYYSHLSFDIFFQKLFVHSVHLDLAAVIVVINHVGTELWGDLNRTVRRLRVSETLGVFIITWEKRKSSFKNLHCLSKPQEREKKKKKNDIPRPRPLPRPRPFPLPRSPPRTPPSPRRLSPSPPKSWFSRLQPKKSRICKSDPQQLQVYEKHLRAHLVRTPNTAWITVI